jgi:hypothetical protein
MRHPAKNPRERRARIVGNARKRAEVERTFRFSSDALDQEFQGDTASAIGNGFLAQFDDEARVRIESAIHDLSQMSEPVRFRRYALVLLAQVDENANNRGAVKRRKINSVSMLIDQIRVKS